MIKSTAGKATAVIAIIVIWAAIAYGVWNLYRWWNYSMGYEDMVKETICEMVEPQYIKNGQCKNANK
jgi:hypothetical protein